jgi:D-amino-acid oxidase
MSDCDVVVIGAGVAGLTCANQLMGEGLRVRVWAAAPPERTTSAVAAAIWYPYHVDGKDVEKWGERSFKKFEALEADSTSGVSMSSGIELLKPGSTPRTPDPWTSIAKFQIAENDELPERRAGWTFRVPVIKMPVYLRWLENRVRKTDGVIEIRHVASLAEAAEVAPLVVNCSGLGARSLVPEDNDNGKHRVSPERGQVLRVRNPDLSRIWLDLENPAGVTYIVPRGDDCILGGTAEVGEEDARTNETMCKAIRERCIELEPKLADAEELEPPYAGIRPCRHEVCLEEGNLVGGARVIHNYGHGGAGVTLSWGCAEAVVELANAQSG